MPTRHGPVLMALVGLFTACGSLPQAGPVRSGGGAPIAESRPVRLGADSVSILGWGEPTFARLRGLVNAAHHSVHVEMYEFGRRDLADALVLAHDRGLTVTVIIDPSVDVTQTTAARLRAAGVDVVDYPVHRRMIDHVKLLVVDAETAAVGGINWGATSYRNRDFDAILTGPVVANLDRVFTRDLVTSGRSQAVPVVTPDPAILVATTGPGPDIRPLALELIDGARRSLDLEQFVLTDTGVVHALMNAHRRGVAVRILLDPDQRPSDGQAARLRAEGVDVRLYSGEGKLHAKAAVADGANVLFGSANWTNSGFQHNHEVDIEIVNAPAVAQTFLEHFTADRSTSSA